MKRQRFDSIRFYEPKAIRQSAIMNTIGKRHRVPGFVRGINSSTTQSLLPGLIPIFATVDSRRDPVHRLDSEISSYMLELGYFLTVGCVEVATDVVEQPFLSPSAASVAFPSRL